MTKKGNVIQFKSYKGLVTEVTDDSVCVMFMLSGSSHEKRFSLDKWEIKDGNLTFKKEKKDVKRNSSS